MKMLRQKKSLCSNCEKKNYKKKSYELEGRNKNKENTVKNGKLFLQQFRTRLDIVVVVLVVFFDSLQSIEDFQLLLLLMHTCVHTQIQYKVSVNF